MQKYQNYLHILLLYCILLTRLFDRIKASKKWFRKKVSEKLGMSLFVKCPCLLVKCTTQLFLSFFPPSTFWMASRSSWDAINSFKLSLATTFKWMSTWKETQRKNKRDNLPYVRVTTETNLTKKFQRKVGNDWWCWKI